MRVRFARGRGEGGTDRAAVSRDWAGPVDLAAAAAEGIGENRNVSRLDTLPPRR